MKIMPPYRLQQMVIMQICFVGNNKSLLRIIQSSVRYIYLGTPHVANDEGIRTFLTTIPPRLCAMKTIGRFLACVSSSDIKALAHCD